MSDKRLTHSFVYIFHKFYFTLNTHTQDHKNYKMNNSNDNNNIYNNCNKFNNAPLLQL